MGFYWCYCWLRKGVAKFTGSVNVYERRYMNKWRQVNLG